MTRFANQVAVVSGGADGCGRAMAHRLRLGSHRISP